MTSAINLSRHPEGLLGSIDKFTDIPSLVSTYVLGVVFLFFAMAGYLPASGGRGTGLASSSSAADTMLGQMYQLAVWAVAIFLMAKFYWGILRLCWELKSITALSVLAPISALWSQNPQASLRRGGFLVLGTLFAFYLVQRYTAYELAQVIVIAGVCAGALGVLTSVGVPSIGRDMFNGDAWQGVFRSKNGCGNVMLSFLTPAISFSFSSRSMRAARYALYALAGVLLVMSDAKTSWLLGSGYVLFMYLTRYARKFQRRDASILRWVFVVVVVCLGMAIPYLLPATLGLLGKDANISGRIPLWGSVFLSILKHPLLGYGYAAFWTGLQGESLNIFMTTRFVIYQAQNGILEVWLELGLVGVVLVVTAIVSALMTARRCLQYGPSAAVRWYVGMILLTVAYNVDETCFATAHSLSWLLLLVGCAGLVEELRRLRRGVMPGDRLRRQEAGMKESSIARVPPLTWSGSRVLECPR